MPRKGQTTVDKDIITVLEENKGYGLRFSDIYHILLKNEMFHYQQQISNNLKKLIEQKKVVKIDKKIRNFYGIPKTRDDGTRYIIIRGSVNDEIIELGKQV